MSEGEKIVHCPHLGLDDDPGMYCLFANPFHRCYRSGNPASVLLQYQEETCLREAYAECSANPATAKKPNGRRRRLAYVGGVAVLTLGTLAAVTYTGGLWGAESASLGSSRSSPAVAVSEGSTPSPPDVARPISMAAESGPADAVSPQPTPRAANTSTPKATATPTARPTPVHTPVRVVAATIRTPTPTATPRHVHLVVAGESLSSIAAHYRTSVDALMRANGLSNRDLVMSGERLIIP